MRSRAGGYSFWIGAAAVLGLTALAVATVRNEYYFFAAYIVVQFVVLATAWNILGGYAGYVNFGTSAFFGVGAYIAVMLIKATGVPLAVQIAGAAAVGGALGFGVGLITLRLRGIFFSIATVAITIILETTVINWRYVGGATGIQILRPPVMEPFDSYTKMLLVVAVLLAIVAVAIARYIEVSWLGRGLRAIRDNEEAAEALRDPVYLQQGIAHGPRFRNARRTRCASPTMPSGAATTNSTSSTPTTSTFSSEEIVTVTTCCTVPSSTAPITGPIQCEVPPMIGMARADTE